MKAEFAKILAPVRSFRVLTAAALLTAGLVLGPLGAQRVGATIGACGGCHSYDPVVTLSDGTWLRVWASVDDDPADVQRISYTVHLPAQSQVASVSYSGPAAQTMQIVSDLHGTGVYSATMTATTGVGSVTAVEHLQVQDSHHGTANADVVGVSNMPIVAAVTTRAQGQGQGQSQNPVRGRGQP